jgi:hypothetical protein
MTDDDRRTDADKTLARAIMDASDPETIARLVFEYYQDNDRADRTPRLTLYLHLGLLTGAVMRVVSALPRGTSQTSGMSQT